MVSLLEDLLCGLNFILFFFLLQNVPLKRNVDSLSCACKRNNSWSPFSAIICREHVEYSYFALQPKIIYISSETF